MNLQSTLQKILYPSTPRISKIEQHRQAEWLLVIAGVFEEIKKEPYDEGIDEMFEVLVAEASGIKMENFKKGGVI
jgi:hypothetical protein